MTPSEDLVYITTAMTHPPHVAFERNDTAKHLRLALKGWQNSSRRTWYEMSISRVLPAAYGMILK
jgi:hypothetical protein